MEAKRANISIPLKLFEETELYIKNHNYKNIQELALKTLRNRVIFNKENNELKEYLNSKQFSKDKNKLHEIRNKVISGN